MNKWFFNLDFFLNLILVKQSIWCVPHKEMNFISVRILIGSHVVYTESRAMSFVYFFIRFCIWAFEKLV